MQTLKANKKICQAEQYANPFNFLFKSFLTERTFPEFQNSKPVNQTPKVEKSACQHQAYLTVLSLGQ